MELDDAYANAAHIQGADAFPEAWARHAAGFREGMIEQGLAELGIPYGDSARQRFDLFVPQGTPKGLFAFVHGGYWLRFDKSVWSHLAGGMLHHGWAVAMPSYDLAPDVTIAQITAQIARFCEVAAQMVAGPVRLAGHSAGGHLVARMAVPGVLPDAVAGRLAHVMPISPVADLRPMLQTSMNAQFGLDMAAAEAESPVLQHQRPGLPVTAWVGGDERPAFLDQARWLAEAWGCAHVVDAGKHHFDVIDGLANADSEMVKTLLS